MMKTFKAPTNTNLKKRVQISFSGGKTSAYMTKMLLDHFRANSPDTEVKVVFANTGREHEETLRFVERCDKEFGFNVIWLEAVVREGVGVGTVHKVVNFETASRDGAPFESSIQKYGIPNVTFNNCTRETKLRPMTSYLRSIGWETGTASVAVGIRADEVHRISPSSMAQGVWYPCIDAGVTKDDVREWWAQQHFNLNIPEHYGNCTSCWKKSMRKLLTIAAEAPEEFEWNARMEDQYGDRGARPKGKEGTLRTFFRGNKSTKDILAMSKQPFEPFVDDKFIPYDEEMDEHGSCGDSCEVGVDKNDFDLDPSDLL
jgi:PP-loop superfamily ATP-utilizing enzyme